MAYEGKDELRQFADWLSGLIGSTSLNDIERRAERQGIKLLAQSLSRWRRGLEFPRPDGVGRLSRYFNVPVAEIEAMRPLSEGDGATAQRAGLIPDAATERLADRIARRVVEALDRARGPTVRERPVIRYEAEQVASAGAGSAVEGEAWVVETTNPGRAHRVIVVRVRGDCLEPEIHDGERVAVDTSESARPGDLVVADHNYESLVKYLEKRKDGFYLVALNGQPPIKVKPEDIVGPVTQVMRRPPRRPVSQRNLQAGY